MNRGGAYQPFLPTYKEYLPTLKCICNFNISWHHQHSQTISSAAKNSSDAAVLEQNGHSTVGILSIVGVTHFASQSTFP